MMTASDIRLLIVADDDACIGEVTHHVTMELTADVTVVGTVQDARLMMQETDFDAIVAQRELSDASGLALLRGSGVGKKTPVIYLDDGRDAERILESFRAGAANVVAEPIDAAELVGVIREAVRSSRRRRRTRMRHRRLRRISTRMLKDRREMRQRVDLICRDLVSAYRRLAEKVVSGSAETL